MYSCDKPRFSMPPRWRRSAGRLMLFVLSGLALGCAQKPQVSGPVLRPLVQPLPAIARPPQKPPECSPTCSSNAATDDERYRDTLTRLGQPVPPVPPTTRPLN